VIISLVNGPRPLTGGAQKTRPLRAAERGEVDRFDRDLRPASPLTVQKGGAQSERQLTSWPLRRAPLEWRVRQLRSADERRHSCAAMMSASLVAEPAPSNAHVPTPPLCSPVSTAITRTGVPSVFSTCAWRVKITMPGPMAACWMSVGPTPAQCCRQLAAQRAQEVGARNRRCRLVAATTHQDDCRSRSCDSIARSAPATYHRRQDRGR
jgi:hypothetical protein